MPQVTRIFGFDYGHRVLRHESKCKNLHGHRGTAEVTCWAPELDKLGRVIDFGAIKDIVGTWIDTYWDHNMLLNEEDPIFQVYDGGIPIPVTQIVGREPFILSDKKNPTAENMAQILCDVADENLSSLKGIRCIGVKLYETPNCFAEVFALDRKVSK